MLSTDVDKRAWYALKVFYNRVPRVRQIFVDAGYETYVPVHVLERYEGGQLHYEERPIVASLLFVRCEEVFLLRQKHLYDDLFLYYSDRGAGRPAVIRDSEMTMFIKVTSVADPGLEYVGASVPNLRKGQRVRVTGGIYEGAEGFVRRVKGDRRVLVAITGVAVVALSYIHPSFLEALPPKE